MPSRLKATTHVNLACLERGREDEPVEGPRTRYARSADGTYIAYQIFGDGPVDIAWQFESYGTMDASWEDPFVRTWWSGLAAFARVILHDRRATGLSSRNVPPPNLETRAADLRTVFDAAGSERPVIGSWHEGLSPAILLAASDSVASVPSCGTILSHALHGRPITRGARTQISRNGRFARLNIGERSNTDESGRLNSKRTRALPLRMK